MMNKANVVVAVLGVGATGVLAWWFFRRNKEQSVTITNGADNPSDGNAQLAPGGMTPSEPAPNQTAMPKPAPPAVLHKTSIPAPLPKPAVILPSTPMLKPTLLPTTTATNPTPVPAVSLPATGVLTASGTVVEDKDKNKFQIGSVIPLTRNRVILVNGKAASGSYGVSLQRRADGLVYLTNSMGKQYVWKNGLWSGTTSASPASSPVGLMKTSLSFRSAGIAL